MAVSESTLLFNSVVPSSLHFLTFAPLTIAETLLSVHSGSALRVADNKQSLQLSIPLLQMAGKLLSRFHVLLPQQVELLLEFICGRGLAKFLLYLVQNVHQVCLEPYKPN